MNRKPYYIVLSSCLFLLLSAISWAKKPTMPKIPPTVVSVITAAAKPSQTVIQATGTLAAINGIQLSPETAGRITHIYFKSGQMVKKGDPLIQLYASDIKAQRAKAKAQFNLDVANYKRLLRLYKKAFLDKADLDKAKATVDGDRANVNYYQALLSQTLLRAPFNGKIGLRTVSLGQYVNPGNQLVSLQALDPIRVDFSVPEVYLPQLKLKTPIQITSEAFPGKFSGKIYALDSRINPSTRMLNVQASVPNKQLSLLPGAFVEVSISLGTKTPHITIPQTAIVYAPTGNYVYLMKNHQAIKTIVTLGAKLLNNQVIIKKGLQSGDQVITGGQIKLQMMPPHAPVMTQAEAQKMFAKMGQPHRQHSS